MAPTPTLRLVKERKLADLLGPPRSGAVYEASGVIGVGKYCYVALDNIRRVARVAVHLRPRSADHGWVGRARQGEGYEAITYSRAQHRFYLMIEAQKHPDGTFKGVIEEYDDAWRLKNRRWVDLSLKKRNTGIEGLASAQWRGQHYLLALCDSQESSRVWIGRVRLGQWTIAGKGRVYGLPRTKKGKKRYFAVEGISWLSPRTLVAVSDKAKKRHPNRGVKSDQSIHIFRIG